MKQTKSYDEVARRMQFEQKEFAGLKRTKICGRWCPEINFGEVWLRSQHFEPVVIGDGDYKVDDHVAPAPSETKSGPIGAALSSSCVILAPVWSRLDGCEFRRPPYYCSSAALLKIENTDDLKRVLPLIRIAWQRG